MEQNWHNISYLSLLNLHKEILASWVQQKSCGCHSYQWVIYVVRQNKLSPSGMSKSNSTCFILPHDSSSITGKTDFSDFHVLNWRCAKYPTIWLATYWNRDDTSPFFLAFSFNASFSNLRWLTSFFQSLSKSETELYILLETIKVSQSMQPVWLWVFSQEYTTNPVTIIPLSLNLFFSKKDRRFTSFMHWKASLFNCPRSFDPTTRITRIIFSKRLNTKNCVFLGFLIFSSNFLKLKQFWFHHMLFHRS